MTNVGFARHVYSVYSSSARSAASNQLSGEYVVDGFSTISYIVDLTAVAGSPSSYSLATKIQYSPDTTGSRWYDLPNTALSASSVTNAYIINVPLLTARRVRISYTLTFSGGTSPTATFTVDISYGNTPPSSSVTNTGTAMSIADGADVAEGSTGDTAYTGSGSASVISILKGMYNKVGTPTETVVDVTNTGVTLLAANASRKGLLIQNLSDQPIYLRFDGTTPSSTTSFILDPAPVTGKSGGILGDDTIVGTGAIKAIHGSTGNKKVYVREIS